MADTKISALPASTTPLAGTEVLPIVQSSVTRQVSVANLTAGRAVSAASVTASTGNFIVGTSGQGIDFSATPGTGTSELLADYEEGTWTPTNSSGSATFTTNSATYTKIGRIVYVQLYIAINTNSDSANLSIGGLPYVCSANGWSPSIINTNAAQILLMRVAESSTQMNAYTVSAETPITWASFSGKYLVTQITYSV